MLELASRNCHGQLKCKEKEVGTMFTNITLLFVKLIYSAYGFHWSENVEQNIWVQVFLNLCVRETLNCDLGCELMEDHTIVMGMYLWNTKGFRLPTQAISYKEKNRNARLK